MSFQLVQFYSNFIWSSTSIKLINIFQVLTFRQMQHTDFYLFTFICYYIFYFMLLHSRVINLNWKKPELKFFSFRFILQWWIILY